MMYPDEVILKFQAWLHWVVVLTGSGSKLVPQVSSSKLMEFGDPKLVPQQWSLVIHL